MTHDKDGLTVTDSNVTKVDAIDRRTFFGAFVAKRTPVVIRNLASWWSALEWDLNYFRSFAGDTKLPVKIGDVSKGVLKDVRLNDYLDSLAEFEIRLRAGEGATAPGYLHDVPFFRLFPILRADVEPFPLQLFPEWYWPNWHQYVQYFMGPTGSVTPLHFDTLMTNNLFFQVVGRKRFILIPMEQRGCCYMRGWRWAQFDPSEPDFAAFPRSVAVTPTAVVLEPGEVLYIPPGTLHYVQALSMSISFNIDWHTARTALRGVMTVFEGAPLRNGYYNLLSLLGLGLGIPEHIIFRWYKSYLNYVS